MQTAIEKLGEAMKQKRLELNLSLKEVENSTSIRISILQSIEGGRMEELISHVYAQGFVRQYASFLGMDGERIVREHPAFFVKKEGGGIHPEKFACGLGTMEHRGGHATSVKWIPNIKWIVLTVGIVAAAYFFAKSVGAL